MGFKSGTTAAADVANMKVNEVAPKGTGILEAEDPEANLRGTIGGKMAFDACVRAPEKNQPGYTTQEQTAMPWQWKHVL
eukprot:6454195-Amphidinium_carterae.1